LNDKELTNKDNVKFETDAKTFTNSLVIPKISASHLGKYVIKASNNVGEVEHTFNLDVLGKTKILNNTTYSSIETNIKNYLETPKISGKLENVTVSEGQEAKFVIKIAGGKPKPAVKWFKEEEEIVITEIYEIVEIEDTVTLVIKSAKPEHSGNYFAQLINEAGQINSNKASLTVNSMQFIFNVLMVFDQFTNDSFV